MIDETQTGRVARFATGVPGLDQVLNGGLVRSGIYMVMGRPGAGKTILGNQICFNHVRTGGRALYVTALTESHARLLSSLEQMHWFDHKYLANSLLYLSGYHALGEGGLDGLLDLLRQSIREHRATLVVVDGLVTGSLDDSQTKKFLHELQALLGLVGCTALLLTGTRGPDGNYAERTMVDGLLLLNTVRVGMRTVREIEVMKHRGSPIVLGTHFFDISNAGITVHPRIESVRGAHAPEGALDQTITLGIKGLDAMLGGGVREGTTTLLLGAPGSGKTSLGLSFLARGGAHNEPALYWGFLEPPGSIWRKVEHLTGSRAAIEHGAIELSWRAPLEQVADALVEELLAAVHRRGVKRLFIDGLEGFTNAILYPERVAPFVTALSNELRAMGVTTFASIETTDALGARFELPVAVSPIVDNIVLLRYVEIRSSLRRLISIIKMRDMTYDSSLREFTIDAGGLSVASTFKSAEKILSGVADPGARRGRAKKPRQPSKPRPRRA